MNYSLDLSVFRYRDLGSHLQLNIHVLLPNSVLNETLLITESALQQPEVTGSQLVFVLMRSPNQSAFQRHFGTVVKLRAKCAHVCFS